MVNYYYFLRRISFTDKRYTPVDPFTWTSKGRGRQARTYIQHLFADTGCSIEDLPEAMDDREGWRERVRDIRADSETS